MTVALAYFLLAAGVAGSFLVAFEVVFRLVCSCAACRSRRGRRRR